MPRCFPNTIVLVFGMCLWGVFSMTLTAQQEFYVPARPYPPSDNVRAMAEWEELQAIAITFPSEEDPAVKQTLLEIIREAQTEVRVLVLTDSPASLEFLAAAQGIDLTNVTYLLQNEVERIWIRDFGGQSGYTQQAGDLIHVDWQYERGFARADTTYPNAIAEQLQTELYTTDFGDWELRIDGGNFLTDGLGTALSTTHVYEENNWDAWHLQQTMLKYLGILPERYIILPKLDYDFIHHIDMSMKWVNEELFFYNQYPEGVADEPMIKSNIASMSANFLSPFGNDYRFVGIPTPPDQYGAYPDQASPCTVTDLGCYRTYTNALFVNQKIIVPQYGVQEDSIALALYREHLPGYTVVGIDCNSIIYRWGAIHCVTKELGARHPLHMAMPAPSHFCSASGQVTIPIRLNHHSGIQNAKLWVRFPGQPEFIAHTVAHENDDEWSATFRAPVINTTFDYYLEAESTSGKRRFHPLPGPDGPRSSVASPSCQTITPTRQELHMQLGFVAPNPTDSRLFTVSYRLTEATGAHLQLFNQLGQPVALVNPRQQWQNQGLSTVQLANSVATGIYHLVVNLDSGYTATQTLVIFNP